MEPEIEIAELPLPSLGVLVRQLISDARAWLAAETGVYRIKAGIATKSAVWILVFAAIAFVLAQAAFVALITGLLFVLAPHMGMIWATLVLTGGCVLVILLMAVFIRLRLAAFTAVFKQSNDVSI